MRKLKLFFACLLMTLLSTGQVWAAEQTVSWNASSGALGSAISSVGGTANGTIATTSGTEISYDWNYTRTLVTLKSGKSDYISMSGSYMQCGSGNAGESVEFRTSNIPGTIKSVTVLLGSKDSRHTGSITVGGTNYNAGDIPAWANSAGDEWEGTGTSSGEIVISIDCNEKKSPIYIASITVVYEEGGSTCTSEITVTKADDPANGTFALDNSGTVCIDEGNATVNVTANPAPHYHLATVTSTVGTVGTISNNTCAITNIGANTTISATFAEDDKVKVTWNVNGDETLKTDVYVGDKPAFPATPDACDATSTTFIGWATAPWTGKLETLAGKSVYTSASAMPDVDAAVTYYAVFAKSSGSASNLFSWAGGTKAELTAAEGVAALNADNSDYADSHAPYRVKWNGDGKYIIISVASQPGKVSAGFKMIGGATTSTITVQEADDAEGPFTDVENLAISGSSNDVVNIESTQAFKSTTRAIKLYYTKGSNVGLGPISIEGAVTYEDYMTTCAAPTCENLGKPSVTVANKTYNSARLTWAAVAHADKYLVKFNGVDQTANANTYFDATGLDAATTYTYQVKALAEEGQDDWCDGEFTTEANFTTESAPAATLTLSEIGETHNFAGDHTVGETVTLPLSATECSKTFVGWDPASNCTSAPAYAPGESYTLAATTQTLYAVYATPVGAVTYVKTALASIPSGSEVVVTELYDETIYAAANDGGTSAGPAAVEVTETTNVLNVGSNTNIFWILTKDGDNFSLTVKGGTDKLYCTDTNDGVRVGSGENNVFSINNAYLYNNATSRYIGKNHASGAQTFRCYTSINTNINGETLAFYKKNVNYEDYSTTCAAALAAPTFSVDPAGGPFDTEISVELDAAEGTIYYTLNGTDPTNESTEYTDPIVLNTCGNKTIKAIAISSTNHSAVASATYEMNIPVPTNSQVAPYSPTEARDVIASGCYDGSTIMYVKGVVKSASAWNETYGNYDVVVRNIGNEDSETFTYYHMYAASGKTKFTSDENIEVGDTILAAGVLTLYGSTYEFANNTCYMVWHHKMVTPKTPIANDEATAYTVEQAKVFCNAPMTYELSDEVYVKGVAYGAPNNQGTFNIHDANSDNTFQIYKGALSDALEALGVEIEENDTIVAKGTIQYYNSTTYQMNAGGEVVTVKKYVAPVVAVTGVEVDATATVKAGKTVQLTATVLPDNASNKNVTWSVESGDAFAEVSATGLVTGKAEGTAVIRATSVADDTKYGECTVTVNPGTPANTDILTAEEIGVSGSYDNWSGKNTFGTTSVYAGNSTTGTGTNAGAIQLRYHATDETKQAGIVLTGSNGMYLKNFAVTVKSGSNVLNVYAKNTAYSSKADLYSDDEDVRGKLIGTVSSTGSITLEDGISYNDNYQYIGMRSAGGALYLEDITITWGAAYVPPTKYSVTYAANGGSGDAPAAVEYEEGETFSVAAADLFTAPEGKEFDKWNDGTNDYAPGATYTVGTSDVVLTAQWKDATPTPSYTEVRNGLTDGWYYTMCLDKAVTAVQGATIWRVLSKAANGTDVILEEVIGTLDAGRPYIFRAAASTLEVAYTGDAVGAPDTEGNNGLVGSFSQVKIANVNTNYIIYNNELYYVNTDNVYVGEHRAYLDMTGVPNYEPQQGNAPRRRVTMAVHGPQVATGMEALDASDKPVKMVINGQLFILRGEKLFDATGRLVK